MRGREAGDLRGDLTIRRSRDEQRRPGVRGEPRENLGLEERRERDDGRAGSRRSEDGSHRLEAVGKQHRHGLAAADPVALEALGESFDLAVELAPTANVFPEHKSRAVAAESRVIFDDSVERQYRGFDA
jgi:hypothetical protein